MKFEVTNTDLVGRRTTSYATEMSKMIPNLPTFHWRRALPRSDLAEQTGEVSQESPTYFSKLIVFIQLIFKNYHFRYISSITGCALTY